MILPIKKFVHSSKNSKDCITPELLRMSNSRIFQTWDRSEKDNFKTRGKIDVEMWCIPDGFIGLQLQEHFKHIDL